MPSQKSNRPRRLSNVAKFNPDITSIYQSPYYFHHILASNLFYSDLPAAGETLKLGARVTPRNGFLFPTWRLNEIFLRVALNKLKLN